MYKDIRSQMKTGDVISFSGKGHFSNIIKGYTDSDISHVGIVYGTTVGRTPRVFIMESTSLTNIPDIKTGEFVKGVQQHALSNRLKAYDGQVYWHKLNTPIHAPDEDDMLNWLYSVHEEGVPYDTLQALGSAMDVFDWIPGMENKEDFSSLFCSEMVCNALKLARVVDYKLNASEQTPADVVNYPCLEERVQIA